MPPGALTLLYADVFAMLRCYAIALADADVAAAFARMRAPRSDTMPPAPYAAIRCLPIRRAFSDRYAITPCRCRHGACAMLLMRHAMLRRRCAIRLSRRATPPID